MSTCANDRLQSSIRRGTVYLVGAGPGATELLTLRAAFLIDCADVIVYDHLVGRGILELANGNAELVYVGKESSRHTMPQRDINVLLVRMAQAGHSVVRLKGGDPFVFGRGGEELEVLVKHHVPFEVVPGVTAASGAAAYAGIPLTHRNHARACVFVTGHLKDGSLDLDWPALARPQQTLVIYMGVSGLQEISRQLIAHGMRPETPAVAIENATLARQRCITATLEKLAEAAAEYDLRPPALIVIGDVVSLRQQLTWFDTAPAVVAACQN